MASPARARRQPIRAAGCSAASAHARALDRIYEQLEGLEERLDWIEEAGPIPGSIFEVRVATDTLSGDPQVDGEGKDSVLVRAEVARQLMVRPTP